MEDNKSIWTAFSAFIWSFSLGAVLYFSNAILIIANTLQTERTASIAQALQTSGSDSDLSLIPPLELFQKSMIGSFNLLDSDVQGSFVLGVSVAMLTFVLLHFLFSEIAKVSVVMPKVAGKAAIIYTFGLCIILLTAHAEVFLRAENKRDFAVLALAVLVPVTTFFQIILDNYYYRLFCAAGGKFEIERKAYKLNMFITLALFLISIVVTFFVIGGGYKFTPITASDASTMIFFSDVSIFALDIGSVMWLLHMLTKAQPEARI